MLVGLTTTLGLAFASLCAGLSNASQHANEIVVCPSYASLMPTADNMGESPHARQWNVSLNAVVLEQGQFLNITSVLRTLLRITANASAEQQAQSLIRMNYFARKSVPHVPLTLHMGTSLENGAYGTDASLVSQGETVLYANSGNGGTVQSYQVMTTNDAQYEPGDVMSVVVEAGASSEPSDTPVTPTSGSGELFLAGPNGFSFIVDIDVSSDCDGSLVCTTFAERLRVMVIRIRSSILVGQ
jgi:hypothetical protein